MGTAIAAESCAFLFLFAVTGHGKHKPSKLRGTDNFDILGTWDSRVELPLELESSIVHGRPIPKISAHSAGVCTLQGRRSYNEDRHVAAEIRPNLLYFAVFDGHGGSECAEYCSEHMQDHLLFWIERGEKDLQKVLDAAFLEVNNSFARSWATNGEGMQIICYLSICKFLFLSVNCSISGLHNSQQVSRNNSYSRSAPRQCQAAHWPCR